MLQQHCLLAMLGPAALEPLRSQLERVELTLGQVIYDPDQPLSYVCFPSDAIVSLLYTQALLTQMSQTAVRNRLHTLE